MLIARVQLLFYREVTNTEEPGCEVVGIVLQEFLKLISRNMHRDICERKVGDTKQVSQTLTNPLFRVSSTRRSENKHQDAYEIFRKLRSQMYL